MAVSGNRSPIRANRTKPVGWAPAPPKPSPRNPSPIHSANSEALLVKAPDSIYYALCPCSSMVLALSPSRCELSARSSQTPPIKQRSFYRRSLSTLTPVLPSFHCTVSTCHTQKHLLFIVSVPALEPRLSEGLLSCSQFYPPGRTAWHTKAPKKCLMKE